MRSSFSSGCSAFLLLAVAACGSSTAGDSGGVDGSIEDATGGSSSGGYESGLWDGAGLNAGDASDAASLFDAAPLCPGKGASCEACCDTNFPGGSQKFDQITLQCACAPIYCGALDAGSFDAGTFDASFDAGTIDAGSPSGDSGSDDAGTEDAAVYGVGACTATCNGTAQPDDACNTCIRVSLGSEANPGPCGANILADCVTDVTCRPYFDCVTQCE